jgi:hypothetical protein
VVETGFQGDEVMNEATENMYERMDDDFDGGPVPMSVPGDFTIRLGDVIAGEVMVELE